MNFLTKKQDIYNGHHHYLKYSSDNTGNNAELQFHLGQYDKLNELIITNIKNLLYLNTVDKYDELTENFSEQYYNSLSSILIDDSKFQNISPDFEYDVNVFSIYKETFHRVLEGLRKSVLLNTNLKDTQYKLEMCEEKSAILEDMDLLKEYLEKKQKTLYLADVHSQMTTMAVLKPQYATYITRHGFPTDLLWESEKMAIIIQELIANGTITENDVFGWEDL